MPHPNICDIGVKKHKAELTLDFTLSIFIEVIFLIGLMDVDRSSRGLGIALAIIASSPFSHVAYADGVCDPSTGWCRMHLQMHSRPFSVVYIKPQDQYGQYRRVWVKFVDSQGSEETTGVTLDCPNSALGSGLGGSGFKPVQPGTIGGEIYESVCLGRNSVLGGFPQGSSTYSPPGFIPEQGQRPSLFETIMNEIFKPR